MSMKRANGTGCVTKLSGNRRNPWYAKVTTGNNKENGKYIQKILSDDKGQKYFSDRFIPDELLSNWNREKGNINLDKSDYTFSQVYEEYSKKYFPTKEEETLEIQEHIKTKGKLGLSVCRGLKTAYKKCETLYDKSYKSIRKSDFENIVLSTTGSASTISNLTNLFRKLDNYALEQDIIIKGYADLLQINNNMYLPAKNNGNPYTYEEIDSIWKHEGELVADIVLLTIYTGCRIEELLFAKISNVYIQDKYFIGGIKTKAGKGRIIPIHRDIIHIFKKYYNENIDNEFLFTINNKKIQYQTFYLQYLELMNSLGIKHKTHDGRKTLHSELDRLGANKVCINKIFGHTTGDVGDDVYSKKSIEELLETIEMVNYKSKKNTKITYLKVIG